MTTISLVDISWLGVLSEADQYSSVLYNQFLIMHQWHNLYQIITNLIYGWLSGVSNNTVLWVIVLLFTRKIHYGVTAVSFTFFSRIFRDSDATNKFDIFNQNIRSYYISVFHYCK